MEIKVARKDIGNVIEVLLTLEAKRATKYLSPDFVISAQRKSWGGKINRKDRTIELVVKIGKPNYTERVFIKMCKKAKEPFPVKKVQVKFFKK